MKATAEDRERVSVIRMFVGDKTHGALTRVLSDAESADEARADLELARLRGFEEGHLATKEIMSRELERLRGALERIAELSMRDTQKADDEIELVTRAALSAPPTTEEEK